MTPPDLDIEQIMTPVSKPAAVAMAEIHAMRGLTDAVGALTRQVERMNGKIDDVRERVIKMEAREYERQIETLGENLGEALSRINSLEAAQDRRTGMVSVGGWFSRAAPWLIALGAAVLAALGWERAV